MFKNDKVIADLSGLVSYDKDSGIFTWLERVKGSFTVSDRELKRWNSRYAGKQAGSAAHCTNTKKTYIVVRHNKYTVKAHRVAWYIVNGQLPVGEIDHIDGEGQNNKYVNLRDVSREDNRKNIKRYTSNTSGCTGVTFNRGRWSARINVNGERVNLGRFVHIAGAIKARKKAEIEYGYHENHGTINSLKGK